MSTDIQSTVQVDAEAVIRHAFQGEPLDPEIARRVQERASAITERLRRTHGVVDDAAFESLLEDE